MFSIRLVCYDRWAAGELLAIAPHTLSPGSGTAVPKDSLLKIPLLTQASLPEGLRILAVSPSN
jgi:hypothetical protein